MWKFHDFCIIQILREINFEDSRSAKSAILTHLEALDFDFHEFSHFWKAEVYQIIKILSLAKSAFKNLCSPKLISHKILKFPHCMWVKNTDSCLVYFETSSCPPFFRHVLHQNWWHHLVLFGHFVVTPALEVNLDCLSASKRLRFLESKW